MVEQPTAGPDHRAERRRRAKRDLGGRWVHYGATVLFLIGGLFGFYYLFYTTERADLLDEHYLRTLSEAAESVAEAVRERQENVQSALNGVTVASRGEIDRHLKERLERIRDVASPEVVVDAPAQGEPRRHAVTAELSSNRSAIVFRRTTEVSVARTGGAAEKVLVAASCELPLAAIVHPVLPEGFDSVLVTRRNGRSILEVDGTGRTIGRSHLRLREIPEEVDVATGEPAESAGDSGREPPPLRTDIRDVDVAGEGYKAYLQPFRLPVHVEDGDEGGAETTWFLCGLKRRSTFRTEAMQISPLLVLTALGVLMFAILGLPWVKLQLLGRREPVRAMDVALLTASLLVVCCLVTLGLLEASVFTSLEQRRDERLQTLGHTISSAVEGELAAMGRQLDALALLPGRADDEAKILGGEDCWLDDYPLLEMAFWTDARGEQTRKVTIRDSNTPRVNLTGRDYFRAALEGRLWAHGGAPGGRSGRWVESIRSKTTGNVFAMLSHRIPETDRGPRIDASAIDASAGAADDPDAEPPVVVALQTRLQSLIEPVLPPDHLFAVLDADGRTLFHSDPARNLREGFPEEVHVARAPIEAALFGRHETLLSANYQTRDVRLWMGPLTDLPWMLVVMAPEAGLWNLNQEFLTVSLVLLCGYLLLLGLLAVWLWSAHDRPPTPGERRRAWYWPDPRKAAAYRSTSTAFGVLALGWLGVTLAAPPTWGIAVAVTHALAGATFLHVSLQRERAPGQAISRARRVAPLSVAALVPACLLLPDPYRVIAAVALVLGVLALRRARLLLAALLATGALLGAGLALDGRAGPPAAASALATAGLVALLARREDRRRSPWPPPPQPPPATGRRSFGVLLAAAGLVLGVVPTVAFYRAAHDEMSSLFAKREQVRTVAALQRRADAIASSYASVAVGPCREELQEQLAWRAPEASGTSLAGAFGIHVGPALGIELVERPAAAPAPQGGIDSGGVDSRQAVVAWLESAPLPASEPALEARALVEARSPDAGWAWSERADTAELELRRERYRVHRDLGRGEGPEVGVDLIVRSPISRLGNGWTRGGLALLVVGAALAGTAVWFLLRSAAEKAFLLDMVPPGSVRQPWRARLSPPVRWLMVNPDDEMRAAVAELPGRREIDTTALRDAESARELVQRVVADEVRTVVVVGFEEGLDERDMSLRKLELLEELVSLRERDPIHVVVLSATDPIYLITTRVMTWVGGLPDRLQRWSAALDELDKSYGETPLARAEEQHEAYLARLKGSAGLEGELAATLARECWPDPHLRDVGVEIALRLDPSSLSQDQVIAEVQDRAESHYRRLWITSSTDEKVVLHYLGREGFVNWRMKGVLRRLMRRGLVSAGPGYRLMNESFRRFVTRAERPEVFAAWERDAGASVWQRLRGPFLLVVVALAVFFFSTQRETFNHALGLAAALTTSLPILLKLLGSAAERARPET